MRRFRRRNSPLTRMYLSPKGLPWPASMKVDYNNTEFPLSGQDIVQWSWAERKWSQAQSLYSHNLHRDPSERNRKGEKITNPMNAMALAPTNKLIKANPCLPTPLCHKEGSMMKSPASISTEAAYISIPADTAPITPCVSFILAVEVYQRRQLQGEKSEYRPPSCEPENKRNPAATPIGTVVANATIINGRRVRELVGSVATRVPSERPSNS